MTIELTGKDLTFDQVFDVAHKANNQEVKIKSSNLELMNKSRALVLKIVENNEPIYGINTGFGALSDKHIPKEKLKDLQYNLIRSHCTGVGAPFDIPTSRAILLIRANCLTSGYSGINPSLVQLILDFINKDITPVIPSKGSVGASGDLAPLSHLALALIGEGEVFYKGERTSSLEAMKAEGLTPGELGPKDGLALINGTAVISALGSLAVKRSQILLESCDIIASLTLEGLRGTTKAYYHKIHELKPQPGQLECARNLNRLLTESEIMNSHAGCGKVQDPYSLRCLPQVHGASRQAYNHARDVIKIEINSVTDNPLVFPDTGEVVSGGNFHGQAPAFALDYLAMGMAEVSNISERRVEKMMNPTFSDLPAFLTKDSGLNSGLMIAHVTSAALASENKYLCHPASIDSIPTSTDKEDHVSMGVTSGRKLHEVLDNVTSSLAIELLCAGQAIELLRPLKSNEALESLMTLVRKYVEPIEEDRTFHKDIEVLESIVSTGQVVDCIKSVLGEIE
ncbi:MAG: histidine ammonia-lyase [Bacteriovoracaceae bacterium]|nr:histidine ammonia-lyase [Bacteriovoracaceae bacterium]